MQVLRGLSSLASRERGEGCIATVGVFDGVHLGHFHVLQKVRELAAAREFPSAVVTFAGHPKATLLGRGPSAITSLEHRLLLFRRSGMALALVLDFDAALRELSAEAFLHQVLLDGLGMKELVLGFDSKFGKDRRGTVETLAPLARELDFGLHQISALRLEGRAISSTAIREAVSLGELDRAAAMLGRPVSLLGTVIRGDQRGRLLGFPTANLDLHQELQPPKGVYAALVHFPKCNGDLDAANPLHPAVVNIGHRPTFEKQEISVEAHLLDFEGDLYDQDMEVFFLDFLRGEQRFGGPAALVAQIQEDVALARQLLASAKDHWQIPGRYLPIEGPGPDSLSV